MHWEVRIRTLFLSPCLREREELKIWIPCCIAHSKAWLAQDSIPQKSRARSNQEPQQQPHKRGKVWHSLGMQMSVSQTATHVRQPEVHFYWNSLLVASSNDQSRNLNHVCWVKKILVVLSSLSLSSQTDVRSCSFSLPWWATVVSKAVKCILFQKFHLKQAGRQAGRIENEIFRTHDVYRAGPKVFKICHFHFLPV